LQLEDQLEQTSGLNAIEVITAVPSVDLTASHVVLRPLQFGEMTKTMPVSALRADPISPLKVCHFAQHH